MQNTLESFAETHQSLMDRIMSAGVFADFEKTMRPSLKMIENINAQMLPTKTVANLLKNVQFTFESHLSIAQTEAIKTLGEHYLLDVSLEDSRGADALELLGDDEVSDLFEEFEQPWSDPVHTAFITFTAKIGAWLQEKYPQYQRRIIDTLSEYVSRFLHEYFVQCLFVYGTQYGPAGLAVVVGLFTAVGMIPKKEGTAIQRELTREMALEQPCGYCRAEAGEWCVTKGGSNPGSQATKLHKPRWQ